MTQIFNHLQQGLEILMDGVPINGEIINIDDTQQFVSDGNVGTSWNPFVIDLQNLLGINDIITDDANDDDWWTLQGFKIGRKPTQPGVYIHKGKTVTLK